MPAMWTVLSTREYGPEEMAAFGSEEELPADGNPTLRALAARTFTSSAAWILAGAAVALATWKFALEKEVYLLGGLLIAYGLASVVAINLARAGRSSNMLAMPNTALMSPPAPIVKKWCNHTQ